MKQSQLKSEDWHVTHCPAYNSEKDNCPKIFRLFSHCKNCPVKVRPKPKVEKVPSPKKCANFNILEPQCVTCETKGKRGNKSCKVLTVRSKEQRIHDKIVKRNKGRVTGQYKKREIKTYDKPELVDFMNGPEGDDIHE